jgi:hypothetical protein
MLLSELFDGACNKVTNLIVEREQLVKQHNVLAMAYAATQKALAKNQAEMDKNHDDTRSAIKDRDMLAEALKVAPENKTAADVEAEEMRAKRQAVFLQMRQIPNVWIKPFGVATLTGLDVEEVCSILRRASKIEGVPLEHNGERGIGSMYRWVGEPITK